MSQQLTIRGLDSQVVKDLRILAASHGRSMEAEIREILTESVTRGHVEQSLKDLLLAMPNLGEDANFERTQSAMRSVEL